MSWYAIRTVYHWGHKSDDTNVFEERIVAFSGENIDEAFEKATKESLAYSKQSGGVTYNIHPDKVSYKLDEANYSDAQEVWSELYESKISLSEFYNNRYVSYEYFPE